MNALLEETPHVFCGSGKKFKKCCAEKFVKKLDAFLQSITTKKPTPTITEVNQLPLAAGFLKPCVPSARPESPSRKPINTSSVHAEHFEKHLAPLLEIIDPETWLGSTDFDEQLNIRFSSAKKHYV